jgi:tetratricopeptide (TPR) repeat protein
VEQDPEDAEAHLLVSAAATAQALPEEAAKEKELALALSPGLADLDPSTVQGLERIIGELPPVVLSRPTASLPSGAEPEMLDRARSLRAEGRSDEAVRELQRALYLEPHWVEVRIELARAYVDAGELEKAVDELRVVLWDRETVETHLHLAEIYMEMENSDEARLHIERALELDPTSWDALRLLEQLNES